jgi:glycine C-acetyltransferase
MPTKTPLHRLAANLNQTPLIKFYSQMRDEYGPQLLKELTFRNCGPHREMTVADQPMINFGFDSFLGLDQDPRVIGAVARGCQEWGTQFGASRAFAVSGIEVDVEARIARWMKTEAAVIFPSVTLANMGVIPGLVGTQDLIAVDEFAHNSIMESTKIARANGVRVMTFKHNSSEDLERVLQASMPYRSALIVIDGVYSMSGVIADMRALNEVALRNNGVLLVDDAHATGVIGDCGRGTVLQTLGSYDNTLVIGCFSKACSVFGAFVACTKEFAQLIKMKSSTYIFGGPVPPPYLAGVAAVIDILMSPDYDELRGRLDRNVRHMVQGLESLDLAVLGGHSPIISVLVGDEGDTFAAGAYLSDRGYHVQSVAFPAVPYHAGVLRIQVNANHREQDIAGLLSEMATLTRMISFPSPTQVPDAAQRFGSDQFVTDSGSLPGNLAPASTDS